TSSYLFFHWLLASQKSLHVKVSFVVFLVYYILLQSLHPHKQSQHQSVPHLLLPLALPLLKQATYIFHLLSFNYPSFTSIFRCKCISLQYHFFFKGGVILANSCCATR